MEQNNTITMNKKRAEMAGWMRFLRGELEGAAAKLRETLEMAADLEDDGAADMGDVVFHLTSAIDTIEREAMPALDYTMEAEGISQEVSEQEMYDYHKVEGQPLHYDGKFFCPICKTSEAVEMLEWDDGEPTYHYVYCHCNKCRAAFQTCFKLEYSESVLFERDIEY